MTEFSRTQLATESSPSVKADPLTGNEGNSIYARLQHATVCTVDDQRLIVLPVSGRPASALGWLGQEVAGDRFYYSSRDRDFVVAGSGQAHAVPSSLFLRVIDQLFSSANQGTVVGFGLPFLWHSPPKSKTEREDHVSPMLCLSRRLLIQIDGELRAFLIVADDQTDDLEAEYRSFTDSFHAVAPSQPLPSLTPVRDRTTEQQRWRQQVATGMHFVDGSPARKIVLSRREEHRPAARTTAVDILQAAATKNEAAFLYLLDLDAERTVVGMSPELLFRRQGDTLEAEAVAGTASRTDVTSLQTPKQHREQEIVADWLTRQLTQIATDVTRAPKAEELAAGALYHRRTRFEATLRPTVTLSSVLELLHPTPAVCGEPRDAARGLIAEVESSPRGMYSGVIGVVGPGFAECAVALRCALVEPGKITFSAGAGLVVGSDADDEWRETEQKIAQLRSLFPR